MILFDITNKKFALSKNQSVHMSALFFKCSGKVKLAITMLTLRVIRAAQCIEPDGKIFLDMALDQNVLSTTKTV